jgi:hypothetical protein
MVGPCAFALAASGDAGEKACLAVPHFNLRTIRASMNVTLFRFRQTDDIAESACGGVLLNHKALPSGTIAYSIACLASLRIPLSLLL